MATVGLVLTVIGLGAYALFTADTSLWLVGAALFLQGVGMASIMPPATELIMSALPREKAGVGSAVSNTMRQIAGALGLAVLGSVLAAVYRDRIDGAAGSLPDPVREAATESIAGAYAAAELLGPAGADLVSAADTAFLTAMHVTAGVGTAIAALRISFVDLRERHLGISHQTVKNHVTAILRKLGVEDRTQAALYGGNVEVCVARIQSEPAVSWVLKPSSALLPPRPALPRSPPLARWSSPLMPP